MLSRAAMRKRGGGCSTFGCRRNSPTKPARRSSPTTRSETCDEAGCGVGAVVVVAAGLAAARRDDRAGGAMRDRVSLLIMGAGASGLVWLFWSTWHNIDPVG